MSWWKQNTSAFAEPQSCNVSHGWMDVEASRVRLHSRGNRRQAPYERPVVGNTYAYSTKGGPQIRKNAVYNLSGPWQAEFEQKQVDMREQVVKFEKFIQENDAKRIRAEAKAKQVGTLAAVGINHQLVCFNKAGPLSTDHHEAQPSTTVLQYFYVNTNNEN